MKSLDTFGGALRQLRRRNPRNVSLADLADEIDCSVTYLSAIERNERNPPSNAKIEKLLKYLGEEAELDRMLELAVGARRCIEIPIDGTKKHLVPMLAGLARRIEQGDFTKDDPLFKLLEKYTEKDGK